MSIRLDNVRLAFPCLFEPKSFKPEEPEKAEYSAVFLIPKTDEKTIQKVKSEIVLAAKNKWGDKSKQALDVLLLQDRVCLHDGDKKLNSEGEIPDGYENCFFIRANNKAKPIVLGKDKKELSKDSAILYSGCRVNCSIEIWAQENGWGRRVNARLRGVQFAADGDAFSGSAPASPDEFDTLETSSTSDDADDLF